MPPDPDKARLAVIVRSLAVFDRVRSQATVTARPVSLRLAEIARLLAESSLSPTAKTIVTPRKLRPTGALAARKGRRTGSSMRHAWYKSLFQNRGPGRLALAIAWLLAFASAGNAADPHGGQAALAAPRDIVFNDYYLFVAEKEVLAMPAGESATLGKLLGTCADRLIATDIAALRCAMARQQYLMAYRRTRHIDRLLDAVQFMTSQFRYNQMIGRESEAGLDGRLSVINLGLASAIRLAPGPTAHVVD
jgi:hypothetical protein